MTRDATYGSQHATNLRPGSVLYQPSSGDISSGRGDSTRDHRVGWVWRLRSHQPASSGKIALVGTSLVRTVGRSLAIGAATGGRSFSGIAAVSLSSTRDERPLGNPVAKVLFGLLAVVELVLDKSPKAPNRLEPPGLAGRILFGGAERGTACPTARRVTSSSGRGRDGRRRHRSVRRALESVSPRWALRDRSARSVDGGRSRAVIGLGGLSRPGTEAAGSARNVTAGHGVGRTPHTPPPRTLNPQISGSNSQGALSHRGAHPGADQPPRWLRRAAEAFDLEAGLRGRTPHRAAMPRQCW